jgi:hypothetical protein
MPAQPVWGSLRQTLEKLSVVLNDVPQSLLELWILPSPLDRIDERVSDRLVEAGSLDARDRFCISGEVVRKANSQIPRHDTMVLRCVCAGARDSADGISPRLQQKRRQSRPVAANTSSRVPTAPV